MNIIVERQILSAVRYIMYFLGPADNRGKLEAPSPLSAGGCYSRQCHLTPGLLSVPRGFISQCISTLYRPFSKADC